MSEVTSMKLNDLLEQYENIPMDAEKMKHQRNVISVIDRSLKELNDNGYQVLSFDPKDITITQERENHAIAEFDVTSRITGDPDGVVRKNIHDLAMMSLQIYLNCLDKKMNSEFVREKFADFQFAVPEEDVRYYKGVLATDPPLKVYFCEYEQERTKREINKLEGEMKSLKESAFLPFSSFGLVITFIGLLMCIIGFIMGK